MNDTNILLDIVNHSDNFDIFFLLRHNERVNKNDLLNFTNLNFNNTIRNGKNIKIIFFLITLIY